jgi:hypothetical protein
VEGSGNVRGQEQDGAEAAVQGVIKTYDPGTRTGVLMSDADRTEYDLAADALVGSIFRMLRQGQRVVFELDESGRATRLQMGSEVDMGTPDFPGMHGEPTGRVGSAGPG